MPDSAKFASVAVPTPLRRTFDYRIPPDLAVSRGSFVTVTFGSRKLPGVVLGTSNSSEIDEHKVKPLVDAAETRQNLPEALLTLCEWAANYYLHPIGEVIAAAVPKKIREQFTNTSKIRYLIATKSGHSVGLETLKRAPSQRRLLSLIIDRPLDLAALKDLGFSRDVVRALVEKSLAEWRTIHSDAGDDAGIQAFKIDYGNIRLTEEQSDVINNISDSGTYLIDGITGSGKTEVYLRVIEPLVRSSKQVLVLVPEIGLTPQSIARFEKRFGRPVVVLHSGMTDKERADGWSQAASGHAPIVLGTRSAVFTPMPKLGAIIVDEEHDASYKQQDGFRYSARDLAVLRGQFESVPVVLGSATPSFETLHNAIAGKYRHLKLRQRAPGANTETYSLLDVKHLQKYDGFTNALFLKMRETLEAGNQVLVFLNRRGFAPVLFCEACNWVASCKRCDAKLTYHLAEKSLICHHCGTMDHNLFSCQSCGSNQLAPIGFGTQRVEQTLRQKFPEFPVLRVDRDSTRKKNALVDVLTEVNEGKPAILVGTQLLAKGHHFPAVTLSAILDVDTGFYSSDFRALEKMGQLILQVGGRAGRAEKPGSVVIQTEFADHPLFKKLIEEGYLRFAETLLKERATSELPPFTHAALIRAEAHARHAAKDFLTLVSNSSKPDPLVELLGPIPALMEKKGGRFRQQLLVVARNRSKLHQEVSKRIQFIESAKDARKVRWSIDIDPADLF